MVSPTSTNPKVTQFGDYVFRVCFIDPFQGQLMAKFARHNLNLYKVDILKEVKNDYSLGLSDEFKASFTAQGGTIPVEQSYSAGDTDFSAHFFFQAEDGIRDLTVTGVQTCALPI